MSLEEKIREDKSRKKTKSKPGAMLEFLKEVNRVFNIELEDEK